MDQKRIRFLSSGDEKWLLAIPWLVGPVALFLAVFDPLKSDTIKGIYTIIFGTLFFDSVHVVFTLITIIALPELRTWSLLDGGRFWHRSAFVAAALIVAFYLICCTNFSPLYSAALFIFIVQFFQSQHSLAQKRGISFCFHSALRKEQVFSQEELALGKRAESREKIFFRILLAAVFFSALRRAAIFAKIGLIQFLPLRGIVVLCGAIGIVGILVNARSFPHQARTNKFTYLLRILLYPFLLWTPYMFLATAATHGTEYLLVTKNLIANSGIAPSGRRLTWIMILAASLLFLPVRCLEIKAFPQFFDWQEPENLYKASLLIATTVRFLHYYMDYVMFRMKDAPTRAAIGPLLVADRSGEWVKEKAA